MNVGLPWPSSRLRLHFPVPGGGFDPGWGSQDPTYPGGQKDKTENRNNIVTNSIKALKMVHIKTSF